MNEPGDDDRHENRDESADRDAGADRDVAPRYRDADLRTSLRLIIEDVRDYVSATVGGARAAAARAGADRAVEEAARREDLARWRERDRAAGVEEDGTTGPGRDR